MPALPETAYVSLAPDWICEVLSSSTEKVDREQKMPVYAREGVRHAWLPNTVGGDPCDPSSWYTSMLFVAMSTSADRARLPPFDAIVLDLSVLWAT